jgi:hypothetical protein
VLSKNSSPLKAQKKQEAVPLQTAPHRGLAAAMLLDIQSCKPGDVADIMQRAMDHLTSSGQLQLPGNQEQLGQIPLPLGTSGGGH